MSWRLYWNLVVQNKRWLAKQLKISAQNAPNKGAIFQFEEFRQLLTTEWSPDCGKDFIAWISARFSATTLLLGALRSEQFDRFRKAGLKGIAFNYDNKDNHYRNYMRCSDNGISRPMATAYYARVKNRNRSNPSRVDEEFELTIPCLCAEGHEPIGTKLHVLHDIVPVSIFF